MLTCQFSDIQKMSLLKIFNRITIYLSWIFFFFKDLLVPFTRWTTNTILSLYHKGVRPFSPFSLIMVAFITEYTKMVPPWTNNYREVCVTFILFIFTNVRFLIIDALWHLTPVTFDPDGNKRVGVERNHTTTKAAKQKWMTRNKTVMRCSVQG